MGVWIGQMIDGKKIEVDLSNGEGHDWTPAAQLPWDEKSQSFHDDDYNEIMCEIIDGKIEKTDDYVTKSGNHYRWS